MAKYLSLAHKQARDVLDYDRDMNQARYTNNRKAARLYDESYRQPTKFEQSVAMKINIYFIEFTKAIDNAVSSDDPRSMTGVVDAYVELVQKLREYKAQSTFEQRDISEIEHRFDAMLQPLDRLLTHAAGLNWDVDDIRHMVELISDRIYIPMKDDPDIVGRDRMPNLNRRADFKFADRVQPATAAEINAAIATLNPATAADVLASINTIKPATAAEIQALILSMIPAAAVPATPAAPAAAAPATPAAAAPATPAAAAPATPKVKQSDRSALWVRYQQAGGKNQQETYFKDTNNKSSTLRALVSITKIYTDQQKSLPNTIDLTKITDEKYRTGLNISPDMYKTANSWIDADAAPPLYLGPPPPMNVPGSTPAQIQGTSNLSQAAASGNGKHTKTGGFSFSEFLGDIAKKTIGDKINKMYGGYSAAEGEQGMRQGQSEGFIRGLSSKKTYNAADGLTRVERRHKELDWKGFKQMLKDRKKIIKRGDEPSYDDRTRFLFQHEVDESPEGELTNAATPAKVKSLIMKDLKK